MSYDWPSGPARGLTSTAPHLTTRELFGPRTPLPPPAGITQPTEIAQLKQNIDSALDRLHSSIEAAERESASRESEKAAQAAQARTLTEALASFRERKAASEQVVRRLFDQRASDDDAFKHVLTVLLEERQEREQQIQKEVDKVFTDSAECVAGLEQALKAITGEAEESKPRRSAWQQLQPTFPSAPIDIAAPSTAPQPITVTESQYLSGPDPDFFDFSSLTLRPANTWNDGSGSSPQETTDSQSFSVPTISGTSSPSVVMQPPQPGWPFDHRPTGARDQDLWDIVQLERILASPHGSYNTSSPAPAEQNEGNPAPVHVNALESTQTVPSTVPKHEGVRCAYCKIEITGANWQCITCTDVNICVDCEAAGIVEPLHAKHTSSHFMMMLDSSANWMPPQQQHNATPASPKAASSQLPPSHLVPIPTPPPVHMRTARPPSVNSDDSVPSLETVSDSSFRSSMYDRQSPIPAPAPHVEHSCRRGQLVLQQPPGTTSSIYPSSLSIQPPAPVRILPVPSLCPSTKPQRTTMRSEHYSLPDNPTRPPLPTLSIAQQPPCPRVPSSCPQTVTPPAVQPPTERSTLPGSYAPWPLPPDGTNNVRALSSESQPPCSTRFVHRSPPILQEPPSIVQEPPSIVQQASSSPIPSSRPQTVMMSNPRTPTVHSDYSTSPDSPAPQPLPVLSPWQRVPTAPSSGALPPPVPARAPWSYGWERSTPSSSVGSDGRPHRLSTISSRSSQSSVSPLYQSAPSVMMPPVQQQPVLSSWGPRTPPTVIPPPQAMYPPYYPISGNDMHASPQPGRTLNETQARVSLSCLHTRLDQLKDDFRFPRRVELIFGFGNVIIDVPTGPAMLDGLARMPMDTNHIGFAEPSNLNYPFNEHLRQLRDILIRLRDVKRSCMSKMSTADVQTAVEREIEHIERWKDMMRVAGAAWMLEQAAFIKAADVEGVRTPSFNDGSTPIYPYPTPSPMPPTRPLTACSDSSKSSHSVPQSQGIVPPAPMPFFPPSPGQIPAPTCWGQSSMWGGINAQLKRRELPPLSPSQARDALEYVHAQLAILKTQFFFPSIVDIQIGLSTMAFSVPTVPNSTALDVLAQLPLDNSRISFPKDTSNNRPFQSHLEQLDEVLSTVHGIKCTKPDAVADHRSRVKDAVLEQIELVERWKCMVRVAAAAWLVEQTAGIKKSVS